MNVTEAGSSKAAKMKLIPPSSSEEDGEVVDLIRQLDELVQTAAVRDHIVKVSDTPNDASARRIQGGRFEAFVSAQSKESACFDWILEQLLLAFQKKKNQEKKWRSVEQIKQAILDFAERQALVDERVSKDSKFGNFSMLINYTAVKAQFEHIDLEAPNHQFGLILTNDSAGTIEYKPAFSIRNVSELIERAWTDVPDSFAKTLLSPKVQNTLKDLLNPFGDVLCPDRAIVCEPANLSTGTLCSLPGSVVHAGPACSGYRSVLFFTASPSTGIEYNPDIQYFAPLLLCDMIVALWDDVTVEDRCYLLTKLADELGKSDFRDFHRHLSDPNLTSFCYNLYWKKYRRGKRDQFLRRFATKHSKLDKLRSAGVKKPVTMQTISVDNLHAEFEKVAYPVTVFRCSDNSILLKYSDGTWEGTPEYQLVMNTNNTKKKRPRTTSSERAQSPPPQLFDGTNGTLKDGDGEIIVCYCK